MAGKDPASLGVEPVLDPARVRRVLLPTRVPQSLADPLARYLEALPRQVQHVESTIPLPGEVDPRQTRTVDGGNHEHHGAHDSHGHDGHDHHGMMAIVGEPSSDGLVMEPIGFRFGPAATPLPGGLAADLTLDGDVVAEAEIHALLCADGDVPDPLAPRAWRLATTLEREIATGGSVAPGDPWLRLAGVEVERALSHTAWLRAFARLLGWSTLVERCTHAISSLTAAGRVEAAAIEAAREQLDRLVRFLQRSRWLRYRAAGRAPISEGRVRDLGLRGPPARASGLLDDARITDPLYGRLGFEPIVGDEGDALARTLVRAREAVAALRLAGRALDEAASGAVPAAPASGVVEGPRGPLRARHDGSALRIHAAGDGAALAAAGEAMVGAEWAAALVGLVSFDLSPWRVT
jgi:hypothetical protein